MRGYGERMPYSLTEAALATGHNRSAIWKAIKRGALSASRDEVSGHWQIEAAELHRLFPAAMPNVSKGTTGNGGETTETAVLRTQLEAERARAAVLEGVVDDLRRRLDLADVDRRQALDRLAAAQERIAALPTDQRPAAPVRRSWWQR
jgi:hypothetical protein